MKRLHTIALIAALTVPAMASANAQLNHVEENRVLITYSIDEASTEVGRAELEQRIKQAAREVCGSQLLKVAGSLIQAQENRACYEQAVSEAMESINNSVAA